MTYSEEPTSSDKNNSVPCPYAAFALLIVDRTNNHMCGDVFNRLKTAVEYNTKYNKDTITFDILKKELPQVVLQSVTGNITATTDPNLQGGKKRTAGDNVAANSPPPIKLSKCSQTDAIISAALDRYIYVMNSSNGGALAQILDSFLSGYGSFTSSTAKFQMLTTEHDTN